MTADKFQAAMRELPLIAILRGLKPTEADAIGDVLFEAGFRLIEVPLNSPQPFDSIALLRKRLPRQAMVGAGTVLTEVDVRAVAAAGGELVGRAELLSRRRWSRRCASAWRACPAS